MLMFSLVGTSLGHEDGLGRLLEQVLVCAPVRVGGQVVDGAVGAGVELERVGLVPGGQHHLLGVLHQVLQPRLCHNPAGYVVLFLNIL